MKRGSTIFLRGVVYLIGLIALVFYLIVLPIGIRAEDGGDYFPILIGVILPAIPFFIALYQTLKLLQYIDKNKAFSDLSVRALKYIKYCAIAVSAIFGAGMPYIYHAAQQEDAPGVMLVGLILTFAPVVIAVFAAVLQKLLQNAIDLKSENDLTV